MTKIIWNEIQSKLYETGVDKVVFYTEEVATPWNGVTSIVENISESNETVSFIDGIKYLNEKTIPEYSATINAFTYPDVVLEYAGHTNDAYVSRNKKKFNLSYRTLIGSELSGNDHGYKIHLIYNAFISFLDNDYSTKADLISPTDFSFRIDCLPIRVEDFRPSAHLIIDSTLIDPNILSNVEDLLYGNDYSTARFPTIEDLNNLFD